MKVLYKLYFHFGGQMYGKEQMKKGDSGYDYINYN